MECRTNGRRAPRGSRLAVALVALGALLAPLDATAQGRVALVIGNGAYAHVSRLPNPSNDAADVGAALGRLGFDVTEVLDAGVDGMLDALDDFEARSATAEVALVFYAGHGIEVAGENYLIPVDAELEREARVEREAVSLQDLLDKSAGAGLQLVILDACRNNPFVPRMLPTRGYGRRMARGLAPVAVTPSSDSKDVLVALSTAPGDVAEDGTGRNSPFATALLAHLEEPGLDMPELFRRVTNAVLERTGDRQRPWITASLLRQHYLAGGSEAPLPPVVTADQLYNEERPGPGASEAAVGGLPIGLKYRILAPGYGDRPVEVDPNTTFRSGDSIKLAIEQNVDGYLYMAQHGSDGRWEWLIPGWAGDVEPSPRGRERVIPQGFWIEFDETVGTERVFLYLSRERDDSILDFRRGPGGAVEVQAIDQRRVNELTSGIGSMNLIKGRADAAASAAAGQEVYVVNPGGRRVWTMIELRHE